MLPYVGLQGPTSEIPSELNCLVIRSARVNVGGDNDTINVLTSGVSRNFHVWNEAWFARHDLPHGKDGWQARLNPTGE